MAQPSKPEVIPPIVGALRAAGAPPGSKVEVSTGAFAGLGFTMPGKGKSEKTSAEGPPARGSG